MFNPENGEQKNFQLLALTVFSALLYSSPEEKKKSEKKSNKWQLNRPHGQERSLVKREMALAGVRRREAAKRLSPFRP
jgi:hypothetical protein